MRSVAEERDRRLKLWHSLAASGGPDDVTPAIVRQLGIHRGEQGIFRDQVRTKALGHPSGVAVGIRHTGRVYADDLKPDELVYHYPSTVRGRRDANEILSIKLCHELQLPLFVVVTPFQGARTRHVRLGWVADWVDADATILIRFSDTQIDRHGGGSSDLDQTEFRLHHERSFRLTNAKVRPNQSRFRFDVTTRYGTACAVCAIAHPDLLHAAHL